METNVLINGEWTVRTIGIEDVLRHHDQQDRVAGTASVVQVEKSPELGLLTQTVVRSPVVNHILPIKMRGLEHNDVVFIGGDFVQLKELRADGFMWEFARKENFGARIRNARVVGCIEDYQRDLDLRLSEPDSTAVEDDVEILIDSEPGQSGLRPIKTLPPQFLILQLDTGDSVFLMLQKSSIDAFELVITSRHRVPKAMLSTQPGMYLSVDPTSRYMAVAGSESHFSVFALWSRDELKDRLVRGLDLQHVKYDGYIPFHGVIQKMEFLYPSSEMVVLLVLVILRGKTRMMVYEWTPGSDIQAIEPLNSRGHQLSRDHEMPLLLIPLKFKSTFILVSENRMAVFQNILEGAPDCIDFYDTTDPPTSLHHGLGSPLWVGWARPTNRMRYHNDHRDDIYIAREDGLLKFLEIDCDDFVEGDMNVGEFEGRCGTALACIDYRDPQRVTGDLLITGGESCAGGSYLVRARETPLLVQPIDNWAPAQDFVVMPTLRPSSPAPVLAVGVNNTQGNFPRPDRLFACSGMGARGAITELRHGLEARIGLYFDYELPIMQVWALPFDQVADMKIGGTLFLLSMGSSTVAIRLSSDEGLVEPVSKELLRLDLDHQTITVACHSGCVIQVTEMSVVVINSCGRTIIGIDQLLHVQDGVHSIGLGTNLCHSVIEGPLVLYTTNIDNRMYLMVLDIQSHSPGSELNQEGMILGQFSTHITSLSACTVGEGVLAVVAEWGEDEESLVLSLKPPNTVADWRSINLSSLEGASFSLAAIESVAAISNGHEIIFLCGLRNGILLTLVIAVDDYRIVKWESHLLGAGSVTVRKDKLSRSRRLFLLHCDNKVFALRSLSSHYKELGRIRIHQIWLTDASNRALPQPSVTSTTGHILNSKTGGYDRLLVIAGTQLLLASLDMSAKAVPRHIGIGGTPTRLIYSKHLDALVVAANVGGLSTLLFLDPDTGEDLSWPQDSRGGNLVAHASGLGRPNERFFRLLAWPFVKGTKTWNFIVAATSAGRLLIISAEVQELRDPLPSNGHADGVTPRRPRIEYHTRHKFRCPGPIYSVAGFPRGLLLCSGSSLLCYTLEERKFRRVAEYELDSFARKLEYSNGLIYALTQEHSLEVLNLVSRDNGEYGIYRICGDESTRRAMDYITLDDPRQDSNYRSLHLISDTQQSLAGVWPTKDAIADSLEPVFEAQISSCVLKFQSTNCRPIWDPAWLVNDTRAMVTGTLTAIKAQEVLGLAVDGSMHRLTPLAYPDWEFLRFLVNMCKRSKIVCGFTYSDEPLSTEVAKNPKIMMHVDGDILKRCLDGRMLEVVLQGQSSLEVDRIFAKLKMVLQPLYLHSFEEDTPNELSLARAYSLLELYLRPIF